MKDFKLAYTLSDDEYLTAVRLVCGAICSAADVDIDLAEDFKVCVTESCLILKSCGFEGVEINFSRVGSVSADVKGVGGKPAAGDCEFSLALVSALVSSCDIEKCGEAISRLLLRL